MTQYFDLPEGTKAVPVKLEASVKICAEQCGAKCCRAPGHVPVTKDEVPRLMRLAYRRGLKLVISQGEYGTAIDLDMNGGRCPFLLGSKKCRIHPDRPEACRTFPFAPTRGCLVWPGGADDVEQVVAAGR